MFRKYSSRFSPSKSSVPTGFFSQQNPHRKSQSSVEEQQKNINFYEWSIKILVLRKTTVCFKTVLPRNLWAFSSVTKVCILSQCETNTNWKLHTYSLGWDCKFKFFDLCIEFSKVRNIQWMRFWLIQFVSRSRTSSPPGDCFFWQQVLQRKPQICEREQGRNIKTSDWSIKVMIVRNIPNVIQNCYNCFLNAFFSVITSWINFSYEKNLISELHIYRAC